MALSVIKNGSLEAGTEVILESLDLTIAGKWKLNGEIDIENGNTLTNKDGITLKYNWILPYVEGKDSEGKVVYFYQGEYGPIMSVVENDDGQLTKGLSVIKNGPEVKVEEVHTIYATGSQLWEIGFEDDEGYFTIKNKESGKILTAKEKEYASAPDETMIERMLNYLENNLWPYNNIINGISNSS